MGGFFPGKKYGGPPVSIDNFCTLMKEYKCYIVCRDHDMNSKQRYSDIEEGWNRRDNCQVKYLSDEEYCYKSFENIIKELKPDWLYLQGLYQSCILPSLRLAKKYQIKILLAPRGELCAGALKKKTYKKLPYIYFLRYSGLLKNVLFQSTSDEETEAIGQYLNISKNNIYYLTNVPSLPRKSLEHNIKNSGIGHFLFLARIHPQKNLLDAITYFKTIKSNVEFDIYGPIEDKNYWEECQNIIKTLPKNVKVKYCGSVTHEQVHETIAKYDAFIMPTHSENYGHSIAEALLAGTPVIISDQTPWTDVKEYQAGWVLSLSDHLAGSHAVQAVIDMTQDDIKKIRKSIKCYLERNLLINALHDKYINVLK